MTATQVPTRTTPASPTPPAAHPLAGLGWTDDRAAAFTRHAAAGLLPGRIVRMDRGSCEVLLVDPGTGEPAVRRAATRPVMTADTAHNPCTGDWVAYDPGARPAPALAAVLPRTTAIIRKGAHKRSEGQVLAANVDTVLIAVSLAAEPDPGRVERLLALAWESGAEPLIVLTKSDLVHDGDFVRADVEAIAPGVTVLTVSAETGEGMAELRARATGSCALIGQSGAGKSTLTNALTGTAAMTVQQVRSVDEKGRHTTTVRELVPLPAGGAVIDTPGLRGVGLFGGGEGIGQAFADISAIAADCHYADCSHRTEPRCAVRAALADGTLPERRWESFLKLQRENDWIAARTDARLRAERARHRKQLTKSTRSRPKP
ncbi:MULTISPECIES: ribosome small subunit-dependent GTPase A [Kitasatospora]|uniref:Small ribosomal subunit biogenesis GTPase RsgA n=1 Tax=Kitasatospora setae (strain ATCC 33774 / DSM 43861 / JCM 3304 / KCC A-0304 / NBRC 14216 / KM-6054) TaxID=452652 RepID=E4N9D3_KITSK|nr:MULTISPECIES: ribosome small subunit-dependent GTPase A [Kitasatospora]BAJ27814.1 putative ribosome biogenesis GTPase RsgA [Kitasatospora setae KM-6054]